MIDELSPNLPPHLVNSIRAKLLQIHSRKLKRAELDLCLDEAYDVFAVALKDDGQNLSESILNETIPALVLRWATRRQWFSLPPLLLELGVKPGPGKWVTFGDFQAPEKIKTEIGKSLASRIAHWEAEVLALGTIGEPNESSPTAAQRVPAEGPNSSVASQAHHRELVDAFIEQVLVVTGKRIRRTDIWKAAGYEDATEFERFQRNSRTSPAVISKFMKILRMTPAKFMERLDHSGTVK